MAISQLMAFKLISFTIAIIELSLGNFGLFSLSRQLERYCTAIKLFYYELDY